jgi:hypothetical protein
MASISATTAAYIGLAVSAASAVAGVAASSASAQQQAEAQNNQARFQAKVAENNATIAQQNAQRAAAAGEQQAANSEMKNRGASGNVKAAIAANDITLGQGSPLLVDESNRITGEEDAATIRSNAANNAYGFETQGSNFSAQSGLDAQGGSQALIGAGYSEAGSVLGGASKVGGLFSQYAQTTGKTTP